MRNMTARCTFLTRRMMSMTFSFRLCCLLLFGSVALSTLPDQDVLAQRSPRFGIGFTALLSTSDALGLGLRGRIAAPVNSDFSIAGDLGLTGFVLGGRDDASWVFDPQVSAIVTLAEKPKRTPYVLGGIGAYIPFDENERDEGGPTLHGGIGWVQSLTETTIFYELNPALVIGKSSIDLVLPFRFGLIF